MFSVLYANCPDSWLGMAQLDDSMETGDGKGQSRELLGRLKGGGTLKGLAKDQRTHLIAILETHCEQIQGSLDDSALRFLVS